MNTNNKTFWSSQDDDETLTENLDRAFKSTGSAVLDLFSRGGAYRSRTDDDCNALFSKAFYEDEDLALKCLFYLRDARGGMGERRFFRTVLKFIANVRPDIVAKIVKSIPEFGRWDDLLVLLGTGAEKDAVGIIKQQLADDMTSSDSVSLLGKWMPSAVTSSKATVRDAMRMMRFLGMRPKEYRQMLSALRGKIRIVESRMSANQWSAIDYEHVPSKANLKHAKAFKKHDDARYTAYLEEVKAGTKKINAGVVYPNEIARKILRGDAGNPALDALWNNLPDYAGSQNAIVMADTSGSMQDLQQDPKAKERIDGRMLPMSISVGLALYFAERNKNPAFNGHFLTFSGEPELQEVTGGTIAEKITNLSKAHWEQNTDLRLAFGIMLDRARSAGVPPEEMPRVVYVISDMQFDSAFEGDSSTYEDVGKMYAAAGYQLPAVVFWQVNAFRSNSPVKVKDPNTILVSGTSPVAFRFVMEATDRTPIGFMNQVLSSERYAAITA